jgi:hypothetical protein
MNTTLALALNRIAYSDYGIPMATWVLGDSHEEHTGGGRSTASVPLDDLELLAYVVAQGRNTVVERMISNPGPYMFINAKRYRHAAYAHILEKYCPE